MKKTIFILILLPWFLTTGCHNGDNKIPGSVVNIPNTASGDIDEDSLPILEFEKTTHDFGKIIQGEVVTYSFRFRNAGSGELLIANITASCGCTITDYPKYPIKPGEENFIKITFQSAGKRGFQNKSVTIASNTQPSTHFLTVKAEIIMPEKE